MKPVFKKDKDRKAHLVRNAVNHFIRTIKRRAKPKIVLVLVVIMKLLDINKEIKNDVC